MTNFPQVRDFIFRCRWLFRGVPVTVDGKQFRLDESLRRWVVENEPTLREAFRTYLKPGNTAIDVGANFGIHSLYMAGIVAPQGHVHAFEPVPSNLKLLRRNIQLNKLQNQVTVVAAALSGSADPFIEMSVPVAGLADTASISKNNNSNGTVVKVTNMRLDDYVKANQLSPRLIKIDVEGAEHEVLKGAAETLRTHRPALVIEMHGFALPDFGSSSTALEAFLTANGYEKKIHTALESTFKDYYHAVFAPAAL